MTRSKYESQTSGRNVPSETHIKFNTNAIEKERGYFKLNCTYNTMQNI